MANTIVDTDYLFLSARIKAMEGRLLSHERMERMLEAPAPEDAAKVLQECGYDEMPHLGEQALEKVLAEQREKTFHELYSAVPDHNIIDVFKVKYDYHNAKTVLKAEAMGVDPAPLMVDTGRVAPGELLEKVHSSDLRGLPSILQSAIGEAREVLNTTGDPQLADFALDRAYFQDMYHIAQESGSAFLEGYVRIQIDSANLRSVVRTLRMGKSMEFLRGVLFEGGNIDTSRILNTAAGGNLEELYAISPLKEAAEAGSAALNGGRLTRFEKLCDDAVLNYVAGAKYVAFGEAPVIGYLAAKENELTSVRIIMSGRMAGLDADTIRERLRESYV